ncbi:MAG: hypothetical protein Q4G69_11605 [Planctomycetia bacterium]|nr:hypothetical protein [Planctomycetia bacterium]
MKKLFFSIFLILAGIAPLAGSEYYVDSRTGSDQNTGTSPEVPWKSIARIRKAKIEPGDQILFARGGLWREILVPHSGEEGKPVLYGAYGSGPLPRLYGSVDGSDPDYWSEVQPGIWCSKKIRPVPTGSFDKSGEGAKKVVWGIYKEKGIKAAFTQKDGSFQIDSVEPKIAGGNNSIQLWGTIGDPGFSDGLLITFRARCSKKYSLPGITMIRKDAPYTVLYADQGPYALDSNWKTFTVYLSKKEIPDSPRAEDYRFHLSMGKLPADSRFELEMISLQSAQIDTSRLLRADVGNIIFDHGEFKKYHRCGIKKWSLADLKEPGQYWFDPAEKQVYLCFEGNPGKVCRSIELALRETIVNESGAHDVIYENLAVGYGAAHGFGGGNTKRLIIRNCDIYYIGGGLQFMKEDGKPVRFGNGIEFWGSCDGNIVENNRVWEIYDAALTNQGKGTSERSESYQKNLIYRGNKIWNSEYSFEYWNRGDFAVSDNIVFENNVCWNAGFGWAHGQRPDRIGCHCMFSSNTAPSKKIVVRNNIFQEAMECSICFRGSNTRPWQEYLILDGNQYFQTEAPLIKWYNKGFFQKNELDKIRKDLQFEAHGTFENYAEPVPVVRITDSL